MSESGKLIFIFIDLLCGGSENNSEEKASWPLVSTSEAPRPEEEQIKLSEV